MELGNFEEYILSLSKIRFFIYKFLKKGKGEYYFGRGEEEGKRI